MQRSSQVGNSIQQPSGLACDVLGSRGSSWTRAPAKTMFLTYCQVQQLCKCSLEVQHS
jgi:hypothetical protein